MLLFLMNTKKEIIGRHLSYASDFQKYFQHLDLLYIQEIHMN